MVREGNVDIFCEGAAYSRLQSTNREVSVEVMKEYFQRAGRGREELTYLDLFCGSGIRALLFCDAFPHHGKVVGVDNDPKSVENAIHNAVINQVRSVEFHCQDVLSFLGDCLPPFDIIEMDPFGGCLPYLEHVVPYLKDGGLLALTFTNSRELFPTATSSDSSYSTHGIPRPHPNIGAHEFGLRSTWLAVSRKLASVGKAITPVSCWAFSHGCRLIARISQSPVLESPAGRASLYSDSSNSFAIAFPESVRTPSLSLCVSHDRPPQMVLVSFIGETWGGSLIDEGLILSVFQRCQSSFLRSRLASLLQTSAVFRRTPRTQGVDGESEGCMPLWGVFARKKFLYSHLSQTGSGLKKLPSLDVVCRLLSQCHLLDLTVSLPQDQDSYLSSVRLLDQFESLAEELLSPKKRVASVAHPQGLQIKRVRSEVTDDWGEEPQLQQPQRVFIGEPRSGIAASEVVFPILEALLNERLGSGSEDAIQLQLGLLSEALFEFAPQSSPPAGFHHCFEILVVSRCLEQNGGPKPQPVTSSWPPLQGDGDDDCRKPKCRISLLDSFESCLRVAENKQQRLKKRLKKRRGELEPKVRSKRSPNGSSDSAPNRRARRRSLQETDVIAQQRADLKLTAAIPHYLVLFLPGSGTQTVSHSHQIFLGEEIRSSCVILGRIVPESLAQLFSRFLKVSLPSHGSNGDGEETVAILMRGSIQFSATASALAAAALASPLLMEEIFFNASTAESESSGNGSAVFCLRGAGLRCTLRLCRLRGFQEQRLSGNLNLIDVSNGCDCHIISCELSGFLSQERCLQSLVTCSCKATLTISHCSLSSTEQSVVLLHPSSSLFMDSCLIQHSQKSGLCLSDPAAVCIRDSEVARNCKCGVEIFSNGSSEQSVLLERCRIHSNLQSGLLLFNGSCSVRDCLLISNGLANLSCQQGARVLLEGSTLSSSSRSGLHASGSRTVVRLSSGNKFFDNHEGDLSCLDGAAIFQEEEQEEVPPSSP